MKRYTIVYERDEDGWWVASVKQIAGCHTQGRSVVQARKRIKEAIALFIDDSRNVEFVDQILLPAYAKKAVDQYNSARAKASLEKERVQKIAHGTVSLLAEKLKLSVRDVGEILGLSHQRIHQLIEES
jgi:predicted RNase H-like HicB family nuclease